MGTRLSYAQAGRVEEHRTQGMPEMDFCRKGLLLTPVLPSASTNKVFREHPTHGHNR
jgi:hypothetical protein